MCFEIQQNDPHCKLQANALIHKVLTTMPRTCVSLGQKAQESMGPYTTVSIVLHILVATEFTEGHPLDLTLESEQGCLPLRLKQL